MAETKIKKKAPSKSEEKKGNDLNAKPGMIAIVRVRGGIGLSGDIKQTLELLCLYKQNYCTLVENNPSMKGMINKVKDYVTFGIIDAETVELLKKKAEKDARRGGYKKFYRLQPPKKGFGRKGIKKTFRIKGALGNRSDKINDLIKRMM